MDLNIKIERNAGPGSVPFNEVFRGFGSIGAVKAIFRDSTEKVLAELTVELAEGKGYMHINARKGSIVVNSNYLKEARETHLYLDVIHELVHIKQYREGKELWDERFSYVNRPTEIEAYETAVAEARRIGLTEEELVDYLKVEWISGDDFRRFLAALGVKARQHGSN